ncbi:MAG: hypothetical protein AAGC55_29430, partial [Myxococcota bacterium]
MTRYRPPARRRTHQLAAAAALIVIASACKGPPQSIENRCIESWPDMPAGQTRAALADAVPAVKWRTRVSGATSSGAIALTADRIAVTGGS